MNKKGQSTGFAWVSGLVLLFTLGILFIIFSQVFSAYLIPVLKDQANTTALRAVDGGNATLTVNYEIDKAMDFWNFMPFVFLFIIIIFVIVAAIRKDQQGQYQ